MKQFIIGGISVLILGGAVFGAYQFGKGKREATELSVSPQPVSSALPEVSPVMKVSSPSPVVVKPSVRDNIVDAVKSKNYSALAGYMIDPVHVRLEASECCGMISVAKAVAQMDYLNNAVGWDFSVNNLIVQQLNQAVPDNYGQDAVVGVASNNYVVGFKLNSEDMVEQISMVADYKLLLP